MSFVWALASAELTTIFLCRGDELVDKGMENEIRDRLIMTRMIKNDNWSYMDAELEHVNSALSDLNYGACVMGGAGQS